MRSIHTSHTIYACYILIQTLANKSVMQNVLDTSYIYIYKF